MLYLICQNHEKPHQGRSLSFDHILCLKNENVWILFIFYFFISFYIWYTKSQFIFDTQIPSHNWMQSIVVAANGLFLWSSVTDIDQLWSQVSAPLCCASFETVACRLCSVHIAAYLYILLLTMINCSFNVYDLTATYVFFSYVIWILHCGFSGKGNYWRIQNKIAAKFFYYFCILTDVLEKKGMVKTKRF